MEVERSAVQRRCSSLKGLRQMRRSSRFRSIFLRRQSDRAAPQLCGFAIRSILAAMMKSFSCSPLIFLVCSETLA